MTSTVHLCVLTRFAIAFQIRSSQSQTSNSAQLSAATQTEFKRTLTSIGVQCGPVAIDSSSQTDELIGAKSAPSSASYHPHRGSRAPTLQAEAMPDCFTTPTGGGPITHRTVRSDAGYFDWPYADLTSGRATDGEPRPSVSAAPRTYSISNYPATQYHHVSELASSSSSLNAGGGGHDRMHMEQPQRSSGASHGRSQQQFRRTDCSAEERRHGFSVDNMVDTAQGLFSTASASLRPHLVGGSRQHDETFYIQNVIATDIAEARPSIPDASATGSGRLVGFSTESILAEPRNANLSAVAASRGRPAPQAQAKLAHTVENLLPPVPVSESGENRFETDTAHWYHGAASWANSSSIDPSLTAATVTTCNATVLPDLMFDNAVACTPNYHPVASHHRTMSPALMPPKATTYGSITSFSAESLLSSANSASASGVITESSLPSVSSFRGVDNRRGFDGLPSSCELPSFSSMIHSDADKSHRNRGAFFSIRDLACAPSPTNQSTFCQPLQSETSQAEPVSNTALMASTAPAVPWCPARSCIVPTDVEATLQTPTATPIGNQHAVRTSTIGSSGAYIDYPHYEHSGVYRLHPASINTLANYYQGQGDASSLNMAPPLSPDRRHGS